MPEKLYTLYLGYKTHQIHHILCILPYGKIPEWPNGSDCKSDVSDFGSSNLPLPTKKTAKTRRKHGFCRFFFVFRPFHPIILREPFQKPNLKPNFLCNHFYQRFCFLFKTIAADRLSVAIFPSEWKRANNSIAAHVGRFGGIPESGPETAKKSGAERRRKNNVLFIQPPAPQAACAYADFRTRHRRFRLCCEHTAHRAFQRGQLCRVFRRVTRNGEIYLDERLRARRAQDDLRAAK